jgi:aspartate/methionine/tyrosine aminotransferase
MDPLARRVLPHGTIDLGVGEARVVRESLLRYHPEDLFRFADDPNVWDYQQPNGYPPLVRALEDFYGHPVVVTCGAKQGLSAVFYALRKRGKVSCGLEIPYWSQLPAAIRLSGLNVALGDPRDPSFDSYLHVSPNNPDGHLRSWRESNELYMSLKARGIPFIHDAAYYTDIYINDLLHQRGALGDVQIYSVSN